MISRTLGALSLLAGAILLQDQAIRLRGPRGEFVLQNFATVSASALGPGRFEATGTPVQAIWRNLGMTVQARSLALDVAVGTDREYFLESAQLTGDATIISDSDAAAQFAADEAKRAGAQAAAVNPAEGSKFTIVGESFTYKGSATEGTITVPSNFNGVMISRGSEDVRGAERTFSQTITATGANAMITLATKADPKNTLRTGTIAGPVTLHLMRTSTTGGKPDDPTDVTMRADRMEVDLVSAERTIKLSGNVQLDGTSEGYSGNARALQAVLVLGANNGLKQLRMTGNPTETKVKPPASGGGGRP